jgi:hypothetical protein
MIFFIMLFATSISFPSYAEKIYKCKEENGDIRFSQTPCTSMEETSTTQVGENSSDVNWKDSNSVIELNSGSNGFLNKEKFKITLSEDKKIRVDYDLNLDPSLLSSKNIAIVGVITLTDWDSQIVDSFTLEKEVLKDNYLIQGSYWISGKSHRFPEIEGVIAAFRQETVANYTISNVVNALNSTISEEIQAAAKKLTSRLPTDYPYSSSYSNTVPYSNGGGTGGISVRDYYRKDGTYVGAYTRSRPRR